MKILLLNNRYPTEKDPQIASYIKRIEGCLSDSGSTVQLLVSTINKTKGVMKIIDAFTYLLRLATFRDYQKYDVVYINHFNLLYSGLQRKTRKMRKVVIV